MGRASNVGLLWVMGSGLQFFTESNAQRTQRIAKIRRPDPLAVFLRFCDSQLTGWVMATRAQGIEESKA
jgi:hypothetical protein